MRCCGAIAIAQYRLRAGHVPALVLFTMYTSGPHARYSPFPHYNHVQQRKAVTIAEKIATEDHEVTQRAEGAQVFRSVQFWGRSATIYLSYKKMQAR